jgi:chromosome segregation ATPase
VIGMTERNTIWSRHKKLEECNKELEECNKELEECKRTIAQLINEKQDLSENLENFEKCRQTKVKDVANVFKTTLQSLQSKVPEEPGELGYIVDKFEVELKSGLILEDGITLVQPIAAELKPESLSTVRISFKPKLKITQIKKR